MTESQERDYYGEGARRILAGQLNVPADDIEVGALDFTWVKDSNPGPGEMGTQTSHRKWSIWLGHNGTTYVYRGEHKKLYYEGSR
jgi:hypothetical protein